MHSKNWPVNLRYKNWPVKLRRNILVYHRNIALFHRKKKIKTSIMFFVCLGLKHAENFFGGYKKISKKIIFFLQVLFLSEMCARMPTLRSYD